MPDADDQARNTEEPDRATIHPHCRSRIHLATGGTLSAMAGRMRAPSGQHEQATALLRADLGRLEPGRGACSAYSCETTPLPGVQMPQRTRSSCGPTGHSGNLKTPRSTRAQLPRSAWNLLVGIAIADLQRPCSREVAALCGSDSGQAAAQILSSDRHRRAQLIQRRYAKSAEIVEFGTAVLGIPFQQLLQYRPRPAGEWLPYGAAKDAA